MADAAHETFARFKAHLQSRDPSARIQAIRMLGAARSDEILSLLAERLLVDESRFVRLHCAEALAGSTNPECVRALTMRLFDWYAPVRIACARALGRSNSSDVVKDLYEGLHDAHADVRKACAEAIASLKKAA